VNHLILVLDDDPDTVTLFESILQVHGFPVKGFIDPLSALTDIKEHSEQYNLVLSNYKMSSITGCVFAHRVKKINQKIKVVIITALSSIGNNPSNIQVFFKPLSMNKIIQIVQNNV
jgi:DNA-binding NtrC family response regulator